MIRLTRPQMQQLFALHDYIRSHFTKMDWIKIAYKANSLDILDDHPRLLRSLDFNNADYEGISLQVLTRIVSTDPDYLTDIEQFVNKKKARDRQPAVRTINRFVSTTRATIPDHRALTYLPNHEGLLKLEADLEKKLTNVFRG